MAESATFIIAVGAIYVAFATYEKLPNGILLLIICLLLTTELGPSDLYPKIWRIWIVETAQLKVFPCILIWMVLIFETIRLNLRGNNSTINLKEGRN
jgi:hypothetical protein